MCKITDKSSVYTVYSVYIVYLVVYRNIDLVCYDLYLSRMCRYRVEYEAGLSNLQLIIGNASGNKTKASHGGGELNSHTQSQTQAQSQSQSTLYHDLNPVLTELRLSASKYAYSLQYLSEAEAEADAAPVSARREIDTEGRGLDIDASLGIRRQLVETYQSLAAALLLLHFQPD